MRALTRYSATFRPDESEAGGSNLDYSTGLQVRPTAGVRSIVWSGPAFAAGLAPGARITAVSGQPLTGAALRCATRGWGAFPARPTGSPLLVAR